MKHKSAVTGLVTLSDLTFLSCSTDSRIAIWDIRNNSRPLHNMGTPDGRYTLQPPPYSHLILVSAVHQQRCRFAATTVSAANIPMTDLLVYVLHTRHGRCSLLKAAMSKSCSIQNAACGRWSLLQSSPADYACAWLLQFHVPCDSHRLLVTAVQS